ncbi:MAG: cohesin domain-containing protein [Chloroflexota bacterium]
MKQSLHPKKEPFYHLASQQLERQLYPKNHIIPLQIDYFIWILPLLAGIISLQLIAIFGMVIWLSVFRQPANVEDIAPQDIAALNIPPDLTVTTPTPSPTPEPTEIAPINIQLNDFEPQTFPTKTPAPLPAEVVGAPNLRIRGVEITQGIQVFNEPEQPNCHPNPDHPHHIFCNNSIPLIAGRHMMARVYLACEAVCPAGDVTVNLSLRKAGQPLEIVTQQLSAKTVKQIDSLSMAKLRGNLDHSINFEFLPPPDWVVGEVTFEIEAMADDQSPARLTTTQEFLTRKPLKIAYIPIQYQNQTANPPADVDYWLERLYPVPSVDYYRLPVPDLVWEEDLSKGEILKKLLYVYWLYAQNNSVEQWPDQLFGWLPQEFYNGGASDPFWCPHCAGMRSSRVAFGGLRPEQDIGAPRILVHEIGHNLGAQHAWSPTAQEDTECFKAEGVDIQVDPAWPYAETPHIQEFGIDLYSDPPVIYPPSVYDMMAYCTHPWISPHTYRKILESPFLLPGEITDLTMPDFKPYQETTKAGTLLVSGVIYPNGTVAEPEIVWLEGAAFADAGGSFNPPLEFTPMKGDDYCLTVTATNTDTLAEHCFDVGFVDLETGLPTNPSPFFFTLPTDDEAAIASVTLAQNNVEIITVVPSNTPPEVSLTFPQGGDRLTGQQTITWQATDADGDSLFYDLLYSPDSGQSWLPLAIRLTAPHYTFNANQLSPTVDALIRVIAHDGFHTAIDVSSPFIVGRPADQSLIIQGPTTIQTGETFEVNLLAHGFVDPGLYGFQLNLDFNPTYLQMDGLRVSTDFELVLDQTINNDEGHLTLVASRQGHRTNLTGDPPLATLTLTAIQPIEQTTLALSDVTVGARGGVPLPLTTIGKITLQVTD